MTLMKIIHDASTGEITELPLTAEEIAQRDKDIKEYADRQAAILANKTQAESKLNALGLTVDELKALGL